jgi:hypothetical protein
MEYQLFEQSAGFGIGQINLWGMYEYSEIEEETLMAIS